MKFPEFYGYPDSLKFKTTIDAKFNEPSSRLDGLGRENMDIIWLSNTCVLNDCPTAKQLFLERPTPGEEAEAAYKWSTLGEHRLVVLELGGRIKTTYQTDKDLVYRKQTVYFTGGFNLPAPQFGTSNQNSEIDIGIDPLTNNRRLSNINRKSVTESMKFLNDQEFDELINWIATAV